MTIHICPRCQRRFPAEEQTVDFIHDCDSGSDVMDNEDVVVMGNWEDYTGSGKVNNANIQGSENKLFGTRADIEGEDLENVTRRGARGSTHRQRHHLEFIKLKGGTEDGN